MGGPMGDSRGGLKAKLNFQWQTKSSTRTKSARADRCAHNACPCRIAFTSRAGPKMPTSRPHHLFGVALLQPPHGRTPPVQRRQLVVRAVRRCHRQGLHLRLSGAGGRNHGDGYFGPGLVMSIVAIGIFDVATAIRAETAPGYLGLVTQPPQPQPGWGLMPQQGAVADVQGAPISPRTPAWPSCRACWGLT